ncbi:hypothetical protein [Corynebacterium sp. A21]
MSNRHGLALILAIAALTVLPTHTSSTGPTTKQVVPTSGPENPS